MTQNYGEIFCQAVDDIIKARLNGLEYDITKVCTIVEDKDAKNNLYIVSDGTIKFEAYGSENSSYQYGDQVLVTIPGGDYDEQKTIINKIANNLTGTATYTDPLDTIIRGTEDVYVCGGPVGVCANGTELTELKNSQINPEMPYGFTHIGLSAEFKTLLPNDVIDGTYGIKLFIYKNNSNEVIELTMSSADILGNPYNLKTFTKHTAAFKLPDGFNNIKRIDLYFYQDGNFKDGNHNLIPYDENVKNLFIKNVNLYLGYSYDRVTEETVELICENLAYEAAEEKVVALRWLHKLDDVRIKIFNDVTDIDKNTCDIRWYKHVPGCEFDEYGGENWQYQGNIADPFNFVFITQEDHVSEKIKAVGLITNRPLENNQAYTTITAYTSNILEFINSNPDNAGGTRYQEQAQNGLSLHFEDNSAGNYFLYDQNNMLINANQNGSSRARNVTLKYYNEDITNTSEIFNNIQYIRWEVPNNDDRRSSMILYDTTGFINSYTELLPRINNDKTIWKSSIDSYSSANDNHTSLKVDCTNSDSDYEYLYTDIAHSDIGLFTYWAYVKALSSSENDIKNKLKQLKLQMRLSVWLSADETGDTWDNVGLRPIHKSIAVNGGDFEYVHSEFNINKPHKRLRIGIGYKIDQNYGESITAEDWSKIFKGFYVWDSDDKPLSFKTKNDFYIKTDYPTEAGINTTFTYAIQDSWQQSRDNNYITCVIKIGDIEYRLQEALRFGIKGSNGTNTTLILEMLDGKNAFVCDEKDEEGNIKIGEMSIEALLVGNDGRYIDTNDADFTWYIINNDNKYFSFKKDASGKEITTGKKNTLYLDAEITQPPQDNYAILAVSYNGGTNPILHSFLTLPIKIEECLSMVGTTEIIYNSLSVPKYNNLEFIAYTSSDEYKTWNLNTDDKSPNAPKLIEQNKISPSPMFMINDESGPIYDKVCISCDVWSQPIIIMRSQYDFATLNSWDGSLTIDEKNGTILATMIGAGKKNSDNTFSGVLLGDVKTGTGNNSVTKTGVYGFDHGVISYAFKEDGTAFLGADGQGRIEIDGTSGSIKSAGWTYSDEDGWQLEGASGTVIDLDDGELQMCANTNNYLKFNADPDEPGKLEMSLSGANIKLNDKGNKGLSAYIDISNDKITSEMRRTAGYYGRSESSTFNKENKERTYNVVIDNLNDTPVWSLCNTGVTLAVKFSEAQESIETITTEEDDESLLRITRSSETLQLTFNGGSYNITSPIYYNGEQVGGTNTYEWPANGTVYFSYVTTKSGDNPEKKEDSNKAIIQYGENGYWNITDSGSYSRIIQTADKIRSDVHKADHSLSTTITQTADAINLEARRTAGYYGVCSHEVVNNVWTVKVDNFPETLTTKDEANKLLTDGVRLTVEFEKDGSLNDNTKLKVSIPYGNEGAYVDVSAPIITTGNKHEYTWLANTTIDFVYENAKWKISDAGNYAKITVAADNITSEVRRTATYFGTCGTADCSQDGNTYTKQVTSLVNGFKGNSDTSLTAEDIYISGVTIAVTFTHQQSTWSDNNTTGTGVDANTSVTTKGRTLWLEVLGQSHRIWINGDITKPNNPFGWSAGSTIYFVYDSTITGTYGDSGAYAGVWKVADSGAVSRIIQTADSILSEVKTADGRNAAQLEVTAKEIRAEVAQKANYQCLCKTAAGNNPKYIRLTDDDYKILKDLTEIKTGATFLITFNNDNNITSDLKFRLCKDVAENASNTAIFNEISVNPGVKWEAKETLAFVYDGANFVMTSISNSTITQNVNAIKSEVRRTSGYAAKSTSAADSSTYEVSLINAPSELTQDEIHSAGVTLAVTFTNAQTKSQTISLKIKNKETTIKFKGSATSGSNAFTWSAGDTIYFSYDGNNWNVVDSGAYSKIEQTANSITQRVETAEGNIATLQTTADSITQRVETAEGDIATLQTTANEISATVGSKADASGGGVNDGFGWSLDAQGFYLKNYDSNGTENDVFKCNKDGVIINGSGTFSGTITATGTAKNDNGVVTTYTTTIDPAASTVINVNDNFKVSRWGYISASGCWLYSGTIGGCTFNDGGISGGSGDSAWTLSSDGASFTGLTIDGTSYKMKDITINRLTYNSTSVPGNNGAAIPFLRPSVDKNNNITLSININAPVYGLQPNGQVEWGDKIGQAAGTVTATVAAASIGYLSPFQTKLKILGVDNSSTTQSGEPVLP